MSNSGGIWGIIKRAVRKAETPMPDPAPPAVLADRQDETAEIARAELEIRNARKLMSRKPLPPVLREQLLEQIESTRSLIEWLNNETHEVAFIGPAGIGKSTAIAAATGLLLSPAEVELPGSNGKQLRGNYLDRRSILPTSSGRTTICEMAVVSGLKHAIRIDPLESREFEARVNDYAQEIFATRSGATAFEAAVVPEESARAIRNMADLSKSAISDLCESFNDASQLAKTLIDRIDPSNRNTLRIEQPAADDTPPRLWLKTALADLNSGRIPGAPFPKRITIETPSFRWPGDGFQIVLVDTKGVDASGLRGDLHNRMMSDRDLIVCCSSFVSLPDAAAQALLLYGRDITGRYGLGRLVLLGLAKAGETASVQDERGHICADAVVAKMVKAEEAERVLRGLRVADSVTTVAFDATEGHAQAVLRAIASAIADARRTRRARLAEATTGIHALVTTEASSFVTALWPLTESLSRVTAEHQVFPCPMPLVSSMRPLAGGQWKAPTLWACGRRNGSFEHLDLHHVMSVPFGESGLTAGRMLSTAAVSVLEPYLTDAHAGVVAVARRIRAEAEEIPSKASQTSYHAARDVLLSSLGSDQSLWKTWTENWGSPELRDHQKYVPFVTDKLDTWLISSEQVDTLAGEAVERAWVSVCRSLANRPEAMSVGSKVYQFQPSDIDAAIFEALKIEDDDRLGVLNDLDGPPPPIADLDFELEAMPEPPPPEWPLSEATMHMLAALDFEERPRVPAATRPQSVITEERADTPVADHDPQAGAGPSGLSPFGSDFSDSLTPLQRSLEDEIEKYRDYTNLRTPSEVEFIERLISGVTVALNSQSPLPPPLPTTVTFRGTTLPLLWTRRHGVSVATTVSAGDQPAIVSAQCHFSAEGRPFLVHDHDLPYGRTTQHAPAQITNELEASLISAVQEAWPAFSVREAPQILDEYDQAVQINPPYPPAFPVPEPWTDGTFPVEFLGNKIALIVESHGLTVPPTEIKYEISEAARYFSLGGTVLFRSLGSQNTIDRSLKVEPDYTAPKEKTVTKKATRAISRALASAIYTKAAVTFDDRMRWIHETQAYRTLEHIRGQIDVHRAYSEGMERLRSLVDPLKIRGVPSEGSAEASPGTDQMPEKV